MLDYVAEPGEAPIAPPTPLKGVSPENKTYHRPPRMFRGVPLAPFGSTEQILWLNLNDNSDSGSFYSACLTYILYTFGKQYQELLAAGVSNEESRWETITLDWHIKHPTRAVGRAAVTRWLHKMNLSRKEVQQMNELVLELQREKEASELVSSEPEQPPGSEGNAPKKSVRRQRRSS